MTMCGAGPASASGDAFEASEEDGGEDVGGDGDGDVRFVFE